MNIFAVHEDPKVAARMLCDRHVVKMILESVQMLSTVIHKSGESGPTKPTHHNHPCTQWAGCSRENYMWLWEHLGELCTEYTSRYKKIHSYQQHLDTLFTYSNNLPSSGLDPFAQAMPEKYKNPNAIKAYRDYYRGEKTWAKWKLGNEPEWWCVSKAGEE